MSLLIRDATIADAALIADLSRQTFYDTFAAHNTKENMDKFMNEQFSRELLINEVGQPGNYFLLAYDDQKPVGYVRMRESQNPPELKNQRSIEIARIYAIKESIGKGVGKELLLSCIYLAEKLKKESVWLGVWEHNQRAIEFYSKFGFNKFGTHDFILGDDVQTDWLMVRVI